MTRKRRTYTDEFKREAVRLVAEQRYSLAEASRNLGVHANRLRTWKQKIEAEDEPYEAGLTEDERMELASLRAENKRLRMERDILKKRRPSSRTRSPEVRVHRSASRSLADHGDVRGVGSVAQRLLCVAEAIRERPVEASSGTGC